jgi:tRNA(Arg) A34 adenosine deaminase TadA
MLHQLQIAIQVADPTTDKMRKAIIGCVAIRADGTLVKSRNQSTLNPTGKSPSVHAEARVLRKAGYGATVYVARIRRDGSIGCAKPCIHCMNSLRSRGVEMVYWTVEGNDWEACRP